MPLLGLLEDGFYVLADCEVFPSDGNGHFFWNVPNEPTENPITSRVLTDEYYSVEGIPAFLYPSQGTDRFDSNRVEHYKKLLYDKCTFPRAIAYYSNELSSVLLDGHHKATACAYIGVKLPCLVIMPCDDLHVDKVFFGSIEIKRSKLTKKQTAFIDEKRPENEKKNKVKLKNYRIINRKWEKDYLESYHYFPNVHDYAEDVAIESTQITQELIEDCFNDPRDKQLRILNHAIKYLYRKDKECALTLAMRVARINFDHKVTQTAFKTLSRYKNNPDIEQFFIDYLVDNNDLKNALWMIADTYWSNEVSSEIW